MNGTDVSDRIQAEAGTELSRLGSEKALLAATQASIDTESVIGVLGASLAIASDRLDEWADASEDAELSAALADAATQLADLRTELNVADADGIPAPTWLGDRLAGPETDVGRAAAGLIGVPLVLDKLCLQAVSFFVNEADTARAEEVRAIRGALEAIREDSATAIADASEGSDEAATEGAIAVIEAAYAEYAERLDALGFDPKPIC